MSTVLDFLFEGSPPPSTTTYGTTTTNVPQWLSDYTQGLINKGNAIASSPYQPYEGPKVAGLTPDQIAAQNLTKANIGSYQPGFTQAQNLTIAGGQINPTAFAAPYLYAGARGYDASWDASGDITGAAQPYFTQAAKGLSDAVSSGGGLAAASPYLAKADAKWYDNVDKYMNPYVDNVIKKAQSDARRFYDESIVPEMQNTFTNAGQYGSATMADTMGKRVNDLTTRLQENADAARSDAYMKSADIFNNDQNRYVQMAGVAGQAGSADMASRVAAARGMGELGASFGDLASKKASALLDTAKGYGALGEISGKLATNQGKLMLDAGQQAGSLAEIAHNLGLKDAAALSAVGAENQSQQQKNLDTAYNDFLEQKNYDKDNLGWLANLIRGFDMGKTTTTSTTSPSSTQTGGSPLSQLSTLISLIQGWNTANKP